MKRLMIGFLTLVMVVSLGIVPLVGHVEAARAESPLDIAWLHQFGTSSYDYARGVAVDGSGNAYVVGRTRGALPGQTSSGGDDAFVRKYDDTGTEL